jgi:D-threonate/D-erythronate kinase
MQIPGESIGIIADDLTGACDTALQFHAEGANTRILLDYSSASQAASIQTWLVNTDSRHMEPLDAVAAVRKSVRFMHQTIGVDRFYKKIDSTLRGHIAQECLAVLDELKWKAAIIAPAFPDEGRRTVGGYQIVRGLPVGQTETALDPCFPSENPIFQHCWPRHPIRTWWATSPSPK